MTRQRYITIQEWMLGLGIGGNDLLAYALVFGFCQDGKSCFQGSYEYIARWLGCEHRTVRRIVARLVELGLLHKEERYVNGVKFCNLYALVPAGQNDPTGDKMSQGVGTKCPGGGDKMSHHNNRDNASIDIEATMRYSTASAASPQFDLFKALKGAGVNAATAHDWLQVRKTKRLANTETGWQETLAEIRKSGYSAEFCIRTAVAQGWAGFRASWLERLLGDNDAGSARARKVDNVTYMVQQIERERQKQAQFNPEDDLPNIDEQ